MFSSLHVDADEYGEVMKNGAEEAMRVQMVKNGVSPTSFEAFTTINDVSDVKLHKYDILMPFFSKCLELGHSGENPISDAYGRWCRGDETLLDDARQFAFDLTVQQQGFSAGAFSAITAATSENVLMPFFHMLLLEHRHKHIEIAATKNQRVKCGSPIERAFMWFHLDMMHGSMEKKKVDVEKFLVNQTL